MNTAQSFNEDGQRILPERLYSPFVLYPPAIKKPKANKPKIKRVTHKWEPAIRETLLERPRTFNELYAAISSVGTRKGLQTACARLHAQYKISYAGKHKSSVYSWVA